MPLEDIDERILSAISMIFQVELQSDPVQYGDRLALRTLKQSPLQDDPTLTAPYVVFSNEVGTDGTSIHLIYPHGKEADEYGSAEIGGPIRYLYSYAALFGTPQVTTRDQARSDGAAIMSRVMNTLIKWSDLTNILSPGILTSSDGTKQIEGQNKMLITSSGYDIYGGENTFFGKGKVCWRYPVAWYYPQASGSLL